jgi:hypothetical protein
MCGDFLSMRKLTLVLLLFASSTGYTSVMKSYRLVWDTSKVASFGMGFGYNIFTTNQAKEPLDESDRNVRFSNNNALGPMVEAEVGIAGYEYLAGVKFGKIQNLAKRTYLFTLFIGRSANWMDLKTNIQKDHYVFGVRLNYKFIVWALKYHTTLESDKMISIQFGLGE